MKLKVLHLPNSYLPWSMGGKEVYTYELSKNLSNLGVSSQVVIHKMTDSIPEGDHEYEGSYVKVLPPVKIKNFFTSRFTREVNEAPGFEEFLLSYQPDILHFHDQNDGASLTHLRIARKHGVKSVLTFHTPGQLCPQRALLYKNETVCDGTHLLTRCTYCQLKNIGTPEIPARLFSKTGLNNIVGTDSGIEKLIRFRSLTSAYFKSFNEFCNEVEAIHIHADWAREMFKVNGIPESKIYFFRTGGKASIPLKEKNFHKPLKFVFVGRCTHIKGIHILIDAVRSIDPLHPFEVHFFGPHWDNTGYGKEMCERIKNDNRFKTPRIVPNHLLQEELEKMDVCVIPSLWLETGPITVFDAFGARLPIVGSRLGGIAELVEDKKNGMLFNSGNASELREIIKNLIVHPHYLERLRSNISETRTMKAVASDTLNLYHSII